MAQKTTLKEKFTSSKEITYDVCLLFPSLFAFWFGSLQDIVTESEVMSRQIIFPDKGHKLYLADGAMHRFVLSHKLIQEDFKGVDPDLNR